MPHHRHVLHHHHHHSIVDIIIALTSICRIGSGGSSTHEAGPTTGAATAAAAEGGLEEGSVWACSGAGRGGWESRSPPCAMPWAPLLPPLKVLLLLEADAAAEPFLLGEDDEGPWPAPC